MILSRILLAWLYLDAYAIHATPWEAAYYALLLGYECGSQGIDPLVGAVIIYHESGGKSAIVAVKTGDTGLMQLKPKYQPFTPEELQSPAINIHAGCEALAAWKGIDAPAYLAHYAGGTKPHKGAYGFQKWVVKQVQKTEQRWSEIPMLFRVLKKAWEKIEWHEALGKEPTT